MDQPRSKTRLTVAGAVAVIALVGLGLVYWAAAADAAPTVAVGFPSAEKTAVLGTPYEVSSTQAAVVYIECYGKAVATGADVLDVDEVAGKTSREIAVIGGANVDFEGSGNTLDDTIDLPAADDFELNGEGIEEKCAYFTQSLEASGVEGKEGKEGKEGPAGKEGPPGPEGKEGKAGAGGDTELTAHVEKLEGAFTGRFEWAVGAIVGTFFLVFVFKVLSPMSRRNDS